MAAAGNSGCLRHQAIQKSGIKLIFRKKKRVDEKIDDTMRVANMNVEGMPWYVPTDQAGLSTGTGQERNDSQDRQPPQPLSRRETWNMIFIALGAALLIALVFIVGAFLFILFALHIWLK